MLIYRPAPGLFKEHIMNTDNDIQEEKQSERLMRRVLESKQAEWFLGVVSFTESSLSPILVDPFLIAMTLVRTDRWIRYSLIASVTSVAGGVAGYILGVLFFDLIGVHIIAFYGLEEQFVRTTELFNGNVFWVILIGAFTPLPYKLFTLVGGLLKVNIFFFILASIVGRFARFFLVGYITKRFGEDALAAFTRNFSVATTAVVIAVALYILVTVL